jgi:UPF0755 protein
VSSRGQASSRRRRKQSGDGAGPHADAGSPRPARKRRRSRRLVVVALLAALGLSLLGALALWARSSGPGGGRRLLFAVEVGAPTSALAVRLKSEGALTSPRLFSLYVRLFGNDPEPGEHILRDDLSPRELAQRLGRSVGRSSVRVLVPEGWNHVQIGRRLDELDVTTLHEFRRAVYEPGLRRELALSGPSAEGYLFPATYELFVDSDAASVVRTLAGEAKKRFERLAREQREAFERLAREQRFGLHEIVTLASVVERETGDAEELPLVAGVFFNRLSDPTFRPLRSLQSDPTAAYGCLVEPERATSCAGATGTVTPAMLRDSANRYNTYRHPNLPPGPIGNPGERALRAVLEPAKTEYLFFAAKGGGKHRFSRTFEEHREAVGAPQEPPVAR